MVVEIPLVQSLYMKLHLPARQIFSSPCLWLRPGSVFGVGSVVIKAKRSSIAASIPKLPCRYARSRMNCRCRRVKWRVLCWITGWMRIVVEA